ncbi:MAG: exodeoxyribonuclease III [Oscillospiraceae bacterium]|nr:exodeoxyribonuclease III [Oscillospiraceae bacterium]
MRIVSWNVNGIRSCMQKGFAQAVDALAPDVLCLQETKATAAQAALELPGYRAYWNAALRPGYSGTAVLTRLEPLAVTYGIDRAEHDAEGRVITLEFPALFVVCVYVPNAKDGLLRLPYRQSWEDAFRAYVRSLDAQKPVVFCGDLNVAHEEIDLKNPSTNHMNAGFTDIERGKFTLLLAAGFVDTFRALHPDVRDAYSWWSYRMRARERNVGWRIDYCVASARLLPAITNAAIHPEITGSDHCPILLEINN